MQMTTEEKLKMLEEWKAAHAEIESKFNDLGMLFEGVTGSLFDAVWSSFASYTRLVSVLLGDEFKAVEWFWLENDFGKNRYESGPIGEFRAIETFDDLLWLIEVCK